MALTRLRQISAKIENIEGVAEPLTAADAKLLVEDPNFSPDIENNDRPVNTGSLSNIGALAGKRMGKISFKLELRGSGTATTAPAWAKLLKACGFQQNAVRSLTIGAISGGPFQHGETITQTTTGASGRVIIETATGTTTLYFQDLNTGTWDGTNGITGGTSGATATPSAVADVGVEWKPFSLALSSVAIGAITGGPYQAGELITGTTSGAKGYVYEATANGAAALKYRVVSGSFTSGEVVTGSDSSATSTTSAAATQAEVPTLTIGLWDDGVKYVLAGARGTVKIPKEAGLAGKLDFEFTGLLQEVADEPLLQNIVHESTIPKVFLNASVTLEGVSVVLTKIDLDMQNNVSGRPDASAVSGYRSFRVTNRSPQAVIDPEQLLVAQLPLIQRQLDNTLMPLNWQYGTVAGNTFRFYAPKTQVTSVGLGDRDDISIRDVTLKLCGSLSPGDDELHILHL